MVRSTPLRPQGGVFTGFPRWGTGVRYGAVGLKDDGIERDRGDGRTEGLARVPQFPVSQTA